MNRQDVALGVGLGALIGWAIWRRRPAGLLLAGGSSGRAGDCCGCPPKGSSGQPGVGYYAQGNGPLTQGSPT